MIPTKLKVQQNITELLNEITIANGYSVDLANSVYRGRNLFDENDPLPMVCILESPKEPELAEAPSQTSLFKGPWLLLIQGFVQDDETHPTDPAYWLLADVKKALSRIRDEDDDWYMLKLRGTVNNFSIGSGVVRPADEISVNANFWLVVKVDLCEDMADPFTN